MAEEGGIHDDVVPVSNRRETIMGVILSTGFLAIFAVALRLYARIRLTKKPGWDDVLAVLSLASVSTGSVFLCLATYSGLGQHWATLLPSTISTYLFRFYVANATYALSTALLKLSLLCQYLRIFQQGPMRTAIYTLLACCLIWGAISCFMAWFPCFPIKAYWDWTISHANCYAFGSKETQPFVNSYVSHSAFNMVLDFAVLVLPAPIVFRKAMTKKEKFAALGLGAMGSLVITMCAWRLAEIVEHRAGHAPYLDFTWWSPRMVTLAALEVNIAILAVSCPVFWPMIEARVFGIVVQHEVQVTSHQVGGFESLEDGDGKSEHGSETALAGADGETVGASKGKHRMYYTEELALEPLGLGQNDVKIRGRQDSQSSWEDAAPR